MTPEQLKAKLPDTRDFWFTRDIAEAFGVCKRAVQYCAKRKGIGRKVKQGQYGMYMFLEEHFPALCEHIHVEVGNPIHRAMYRKRIKTSHSYKKN
jgi:hypothetical protein